MTPHTPAINPKLTRSSQPQGEKDISHFGGRKLGIHKSLTQRFSCTCNSNYDADRIVLRWTPFLGSTFWMPCVPPPWSLFPSDRSRGGPHEATSIGCRAIFPGACVGRANEELDNRDIPGRGCVRPPGHVLARKIRDTLIRVSEAKWSI
jgi:hypothetical protein